MPARSSPNSRSVQSFPAGKAPLVGHPLHFIFAACGIGGGTRGLLLSVPSFLPSATILGSCIGSGSLAVGNHQLLPSVLPPFPIWLGARRSLLLPGQQRTENVGSSSSSSSSGSSWFCRSIFGSISMAAEGERSPISSMSGSSSDRTSSGGGGVEGVEAKGSTDSFTSLKTGPGAAAASGDVETRGGGADDSKDFPIVTMDPDAVQKFAEIEVRWGGDKSSEPTILIRGLKSAEYHVEAAEPTMVRLREAGAEATITGGGRIKHSSKRRSIFIYGYSMQFGPANLPRVADLCRKQFGPDFEVTWTEGGY